MLRLGGIVAAGALCLLAGSALASPSGALAIGSTPTEAAVSDSSDSLLDSGSLEMAVTFSSPFSSAISRTPCVLRPITEISLAFMRMSMPPLVTSITSSASFTCTRPTTLPLRSVVLMSMMPLPPRP